MTYSCINCRIRVFTQCGIVSIRTGASNRTTAGLQLVSTSFLYTDLRPSQTCHSKVMHRKEMTHSDGTYEKKSSRWAWLTIWDKVKIPWYTHRLMHRKRVACELRDCYFRLMTIKRAIPKIEWVIELLYNLVGTGSQTVGDQMS